MDRFKAAFAVMADQLGRVCGARVIWKDADPVRWPLLPAELTQHRHPFCLSTKRQTGRLAICCRADSVAPSSEGVQRRRCPFGVVERVVPVRRDGVQLGLCYVGVWTGWAAKSPPRERSGSAQAAAEICARLLAGIVHLHPGASATADPRLAAARAYLDAHLGMDLRAAFAARHLGLSTSRFVHWFAAAAGRSWSQELRERVLARAADMLRGTDRSVTDIALSSGFASPAGFTAAFTRHYGQPPARWRRAMAIAGE